MQFIDQVKVQVLAGDGGDGIVAFRREKYVPAGGPSGGNGGRGGSVILEATTQLQTLLDFKFRHVFQAQPGARGGPKGMTGATADDLVLPVPCGTAIYDAETGKLIGELLQGGDRLCVAKGGKGGLGNEHFLSNHNRAPEKCLPGLPGEIRTLRMELKLIAEVGIIGLPNAGKSTLISVLSAARPKIADYPFTTLVPNLGVVRRDTGDGTVFADIPGLIEGAHAGVGLGHDFLRHVERTKLLIHLIDIVDDQVLQNYQTIQDELSSYGRGLSDRPQILAFNKNDASDPDLTQYLTEELEARSGSQVFVISAATQAGLQPLLQEIWRQLDDLRAAEAAAEQALQAAIAPPDQVQASDSSLLEMLA